MEPGSGKHFLCSGILVLTVASFSLCSGCASLPKVADVIDSVPTAQGHRQIVSSKGLLSQAKSKDLLKRLKKTVAATDILERHAVVVESITESPLTKGNRVVLLADGKATYAAMFTAIKAAKKHINLESYIFEDDDVGRSFADLLLQKQADGVQVNIIYDSMGSLNTPRVFFQRLIDAHIRVVEFNPLNPLKVRDGWELKQRDHRKILIVDGKVAIIGGINISKVYSSGPFKRKEAKDGAIHWRDTDVQIEGPAVAEFQRLFVDTWLMQTGVQLSVQNYFPALKETGNVLVRVIGSTPGETNRIPFMVYVSAISFAEHSIHITNSYFIPDEQIVTALAEAAGRGVDVKLIIPGITDSKIALHAQRYHYAGLLKAGVKIYEHDSSLLHAKTATIDNVWSTVGSTNLDFLSMLYNDEVNAIILSHTFAVEMEQMFARDLAASRRIHQEEWNQRPVVNRIKEWFVNLFVEWL